MEKKDIKDILSKVESGEFNQEEEQMAKLWLFQLNNKNRIRLSASELDTANRKIWHRLKVAETSRPTVIRLWSRIAVAAAATIIIFGVGLFIYKQKENTQHALFANDIAPGKTGATLTLSNGKKIRLSNASDGELAKEAGVVITKTVNDQLMYRIKESTPISTAQNTLSTGPGETYIMTLPDQSKVWLNASSSLTFSASLVNGGKRSVKLSGEAYFEVSKDKAHPFVVRTDAQEVEVLGTHFNINSYPEERSTQTTLVEGLVRVYAKEKNRTAVIKPGQQSVVSKGSLTVHNVDVDGIIAWKNGYFNFEDESLGHVMAKISRWYNVDVEFENKDLRDKVLSGTVSQYKSISHVLKAIELTHAAKFSILKNRIIVKQYVK